MQLNPVSYSLIQQPGLGTMFGFLAQDVQKIFPNLVVMSGPTPLTPDGTLTLNYTGLIAPIVKSIQEIASISGTFQQNLIAWLGDTKNGVTDFFAQTVHTQKICTMRSDGVQVCASDDQLAALLAQAASAGSATQNPIVGAFTGSTSSTSTAPTLLLNGNNPATIDVGASYADLGATITSPQADLNLGITVEVDNATSTDNAVHIDTSKPGTHTILYTVTDPQGLTGSVTRTVIVATPSTTPTTDASTTVTISDPTSTASTTTP